ncbi:MAG TPA: MgtC/SapB family protein [Gemmatimonadaceae bacterium]|jgi:putative Mg2+ transporter-C (MgtC) family protein|nr:MgtC/SapB family protein [Gemmatimonadaceae bacterium]
MPPVELALRLGTAIAGGGLIGLERQWHQHRAGLRTNVLVALGAALFVVLGAMTPGESSPTRIASYVVSGVGFLGAGAIMRDGLDVRGLNTAATLWCAAAVGSLAGLGYFMAAALGAAAIVGTNITLRPVARRLGRPTPTAEAPVAYTVTVRCRRVREGQIRALLLREIQPSALALHRLHSIQVAPGGAVAEVHAHVLATRPSDAVLEQVVARLWHERDVSEVSWSLGWDEGDAPTEEALVGAARGLVGVPGGPLIDGDEQRRANGAAREPRSGPGDFGRRGDGSSQPPSRRVTLALMATT